MNTDSSTPAVPAGSLPTGEATACDYLAQELPKARKALRRARTIGIILICAIGAYMGILTTILVGFLQPKTAAQVASGMIAQRVQSEGAMLATHVEREVPAFIRQIPDYLIKQMPGYRKQLQDQLEADYQSYCNTFARQLGTEMDKALEQHKADIKSLLENANDRTAIRKILPDFEQMLTEFTKTDVEGRAIKKHIDDVAATLAEVEKRMDRLANAGDLTPPEKQARHALALLAKVIEDNTNAPDGAASTSVTALPKRAPRG